MSPRTSTWTETEHSGGECFLLLFDAYRCLYFEGKESITSVMIVEIPTAMLRRSSYMMQRTQLNSAVATEL